MDNGLSDWAESQRLRWRMFRNQSLQFPVAGGATVAGAGFAPQIAERSDFQRRNGQHHLLFGHLQATANHAIRAGLAIFGSAGTTFHNGRRAG
jgi:hypothetical protein